MDNAFSIQVWKVRKQDLGSFEEQYSSNRNSVVEKCSFESCVLGVKRLLHTKRIGKDVGNGKLPSHVFIQDCISPRLQRQEQVRYCLTYRCCSVTHLGNKCVHLHLQQYLLQKGPSLILK